MANRRREPDSDGTTTEAGEYNTVFVDTSLDTNLAMLVFKPDTVSDFKKKIVLEHMQCFPKIVDICIHSLKVKRKAIFYHLPDSMHIWSAFHGAKGNWFLSADASCTSMCHLNPNSSELGLTKFTTMDVRNVDNSCRGLSPDINRIQQTIPISLPEMIPGFTVKNSLEKTADVENSHFLREKCTETESPSKKKCKTTEEDVCRNRSSKVSDTLFDASVTDTVMPGVVYCGKSMVDEVKEGLNLCEELGKPSEVSGLKNDQSVLDNRVAFEGLFVPAVVEKSNLSSDKRKGDTLLENKIPENLMANPKEYELGQDVGSMDAQETAMKDTENLKSETTSISKKQKKKKKATKSANDDIEGLAKLSTGHNVVSEKREPDKENRYSAGNGHADIPVVENSENTDNTDKKTKKKRKKKTLKTSDAQGDYPVEDQKNGNGENSTSFINSEPDGIHVASSQVPSCQSKEKHEEKHEIAVKKTDDPAITTKDNCERTNFKEFFLPCKVKNANQQCMEMKSLKKVKTNVLPSVSISAEVQSSSKLSADHESKKKSCVRKDSGKRQGDSAHNSNSSRRSSRVLENEVKDCSNSEMPERNLRKPMEIIAESSTLKRKEASLVKSSLEKFPGKSGNKRSLFGLNVTNRKGFKTPKKKSLLTKPGALFNNFSGESSGDGNGTAHSSGSTRSPSDSSSMSDHSMSLSQDTTRNRSSDAQGRSTRGKGTSKLDLLDSEEMTMDMILRSSKRFKKARLIASQNEANQNESMLIEFVPDSLPF